MITRQRLTTVPVQSKVVGKRQCHYRFEYLALCITVRSGWSAPVMPTTTDGDDAILSFRKRLFDIRLMRNGNIVLSFLQHVRKSSFEVGCCYFFGQQKLAMEIQCNIPYSYLDIYDGYSSGAIRLHHLRGQYSSSLIVVGKQQWMFVKLTRPSSSIGYANVTINIDVVKGECRLCRFSRYVPNRCLLIHRTSFVC